VTCLGERPALRRRARGRKIRRGRDESGSREQRTSRKTGAFVLSRGTEPSPGSGRNRNGNLRFAFGKTEADHGNRGAAGSRRSVARRAFGRALASVPRENSGSVGVPVAKTEWREENDDLRHSSGVTSREKTIQQAGGARIGRREENTETKTQSTPPVLVKKNERTKKSSKGFGIMVVAAWLPRTA
jgi:hypothetical protein